MSRPSQALTQKGQFHAPAAVRNANAPVPPPAQGVATLQSVHQTCVPGLGVERLAKVDPADRKNPATTDPIPVPPPNPLAGLSTTFALPEASYPARISEVTGLPAF